MNDGNMPTNGQNINAIEIQPVEGEARIRDLDLAKRLGFEDPHKIRDLIRRYEAALSALGVSATVAETSGSKGGRPGIAFYLNRKQAIFITAKSETPEATDITIEIIERFDAYERGAALAINFEDPRFLQHLLVEHLGKRIEAEQRADVAEKRVAEAMETVDAFDRIAKADGSLNITETAKALQIRLKDLTGFLSNNGWIYKRAGSDHWLGYQTHTSNGDLEHKVTTILQPDGSERVKEQVRVTPKGLAKLAKLMPARLQEVA